MWSTTISSTTICSTGLEVLRHQKSPTVSIFTVAPAPAPVLTASGVPQSREDAYRQLGVIAEYLARYEPHSPVPYLIQRALEWGRKPLPVLLAELTSGDADGQKLWSFLGLLPGEPVKSK